MDRLLLYWTAERCREDALLELPYRPEVVEGASRHFDDVVGRIDSGDFEVQTRPEAKICKECDLRPYCEGQGTIPVRG